MTNPNINDIFRASESYEQTAFAAALVGVIERPSNAAIRRGLREALVDPDCCTPTPEHDMSDTDDNPFDTMRHELASIASALGSHLKIVRDERLTQTALLTDIRDVLTRDEEEPTTPDEWRAYAAYAAEKAKGDEPEELVRCGCGRVIPCRHCASVDDSEGSVNESGGSVDTAPDEAPDLRSVNVTVTDVFAAPDEYGFLRINVGPATAVIDPEARNVTVTDVDTAPAVDPDEPLAKVEQERDFWQEQYDDRAEIVRGMRHGRRAERERAEKAEAETELTRQALVAARDRAEQAEEAAERRKVRYEALRDDVEKQSPTTHLPYHSRDEILARDDEREQS